MAKSEFGKVAVLMGGWSSERSISLESGGAVVSALQESGIDAVAYDLKPQTVASLATSQFDHAFIAIHGRGGEDGTLQGMLEMLKVPYTGSGVLASALSMDKVVTKQIWSAQELPTPLSVIVEQQSDIDDISAQIGFPFALKPVCEGSSIGVSKVESRDDFETAKNTALEVSKTIFAETWVAGEEYAVALLEDKILPPIRLEPSRTFYDYTAKYEDDKTQYHCPCGLSADETASLEALCLRACQALGVEGWGRVDVIRDPTGDFWLLEVNTVPGLTSHSLVPMSAKVAGIDFKQLTLKILGTARRTLQ